MFRDGLRYGIPRFIPLRISKVAITIIIAGNSFLALFRREGVSQAPK
jgi:hypothetical protein